MIKRWLKKREFVVYALLHLYAVKSGSNCANEEEFIELIAPVLGSRRVARNVIRHLVRQGLLVRVKPLHYCVKSLDETIELIVATYICGRLRRLGLSAVVRDNRKCVLEVADNSICNRLKLLASLGLVECGYSSS